MPERRRRSRRSFSWLIDTILAPFYYVRFLFDRYVLGKVGRGDQPGHGIKGLALGLLDLILYPLFLLSQLLQAPYHWITGQKRRKRRRERGGVVRAMAAPFVGIAYRLRSFFRSSGGRRHRSSRARHGWRWLQILTLPIWLPWAVLRRTVKIALHRSNRKRLLYASPVLLMLAVVVGIVLISVLFPKSRLIARYDREAYSAYVSKDYATAETYYRRLCSMDNKQPRFRYMLALVREAQGDLSGAISGMTSIAPDDRIGEGPAHLWLARLISSNPQAVTLLGATPDQRTKLLRHHIEATLRWDEDNLTALMMRAGLDAELDPAKAIEDYRRIVDQEPRALLRIAALEAKQGDQEAKEASLRELLKALEPRWSERPMDNTVFLDTLSAQALLGEYTEGLAFVDRFAQEVGSEVATNGRAALHIARINAAVSGERPSTPDELLESLDVAMRSRAEAPVVYRTLARLIRESKANSSAMATAAARRVAAGDLSPAVRLTLGIVSWAQGERRAARDHWRQVAQLGLPGVVVLNNFAFANLGSSTDDLEQMEAILEAALAPDPEQPQVLVTRARLRVLQGDFQAALVDLELARSKTPDDVSILTSLADVYRQLGDEEQARETTARAVQLQQAEREKNESETKDSPAPR